MSRLSKEQKKKLDEVVEEKQLFVKINNLLKQYGAGDLQLTALTVQPMVVKNIDISNFVTESIISNVLASTNGQPDFSVFPPLCQHGKPMVQRCTIGGSCRWVCNH